MTSSAAATGRRAHVTAVIVSHDGADWIPRLLSSLEAATVRPDRVVAVDTGSTDRSADLLRAGLGAASVLSADRSTGYGAAVQLGLDHLDALHADRPDEAADRTDDDHWVWLLHDDLAVDPEALAALLAAVRAEPATDVVGPRVRQWPRRLRLLEVGLTVTGTARRLTGVEPGEYDQGQHYRPHDVLAVGSAGLLVRRRVWDALGGFSPRLSLFADDLDFGWRATRAGYRVGVAPAAIVYHVQAATDGRRSAGAVRGRPARVSRQHHLMVVLRHCRAWAVPLLVVRFVLGSLLRMLGLLLTRSPRRALDELAALGGLLAFLPRLPGWRREALPRGDEQRRASRAEVRQHLPPWWTPYRIGIDAVGQFGVDLIGAVGGAQLVGRRPTETGPVPEEAEDLEPETGPLTRIRRRPMLGVFALLVVLALFAPGLDLAGPGLLHGGALLPAPPGVGDWWRLYGESWHAVGTGSDAAAPPYVLVLALLGSVLAAKEWLAVDLLLGLAVPLSAVTAYAGLRRVVRSRWVRIWAAVAYALLPVLTGAVAQGRFGTVAATVLAPLVLLPLAGLARGRDVNSRIRSGLATGLALAAVVAFAPPAWPVAGATLVVWAAVDLARPGRRPVGTLLATLGAVATPLLLLMPWTWQLGTDLDSWLADTGFAVGVPAGTAGWLPGLGDTFGAAPTWFGYGLAAAAVVALLRADRRAGVLTAWLGGLAALGTVLVQQQHGVWPGFTIVMLYGAAIAAAALAADGVLETLAGASFGWRQPLALVTAVAAVAVPVAGAVWWMSSDQTLLHRGTPVDLPAYMADAQRTAAQPRTLVLEHGDGGVVRYHLSRDAGVFLGQESMQSGDELAPLVARLVSDPARGDAQALADAGVGFIVLRGADTDISAAIDGAAGLQRASAADEGAVAWRVDLPSGGVRVVPADPRQAVVLPSRAGTVSTRIDPSDDAPRRLVVAERAGDRWRAELDGTALTAAEPADGWAQTFELPADGGHLEVGYDTARGWWIAGQVAVLVLALVLAAPTRRRPDDETD